MESEIGDQRSEVGGQTAHHSPLTAHDPPATTRPIRRPAWLDRASAPLWLGVWFGLLTGLAEAGHYRLLLALHRLPLFTISADYAVAAPLADLCVFGGVGLLWLMVYGSWITVHGSVRASSLHRPSTLDPSTTHHSPLTSSPHRLAVFVFSFGTCFVLLRHVSAYWLPVTTLAEVLLAVGLAVQLTRTLLAHPAATAALVKWTTPAMLLVVGGLGFFEYERSRDVPPAMLQSAAPGESRAARPNVLFIVMDTVRAQSLGLYGYERDTTPNLERLARRGVVFERAIAPAPWTLPSHASMFTGFRAGDCSADWCVPLDGKHRTLAEELAQRGYTTAAFVGNIYYCGRHTGLDRGFQSFRGASLQSADALRNTELGRLLCRNALARTMCGWYHWPGRKNAEAVNAEFLAWLGERPRDRPYFAFLNYFDAHNPYLDPATNGPGDGPCFVNHWKNDYTATQLADFRERYERCIQSLDANVGRLFDELERRGELKNTLVVITSDHGEQFGEHELTGHSNSLYRQLTQVPLIVIHAGRVPPGIRVPNVVGTREIAATILEAAGGKGGSGIPGRPLSRFWRPHGSQSVGFPVAESPVMSQVTKGINVPDWFPNAKAGLSSVWTDRLHYIRRFDDGSEQLFDVERDPEELNDLSGTPRGKSNLPRFRKLAIQPMSQK